MMPQLNTVTILDTRSRSGFCDDIWVTIRALEVIGK